jgi:hypothetical protein
MKNKILLRALAVALATVRLTAAKMFAADNAAATAAVLRGADAKIAALLTPEQSARYEKFEEKNWPPLRALRAEP